MEKYLCNTDEVIDLIKDDRILLLAGDEKNLDKLPKGNWIAGTIPYFMDKDGCCFSTDLVHVTDITDVVEDFKLVEYNEDNINNIMADEYGNGFTVLIFPALANVMKKFSLEVPNYNGLYKNPLTGWVAGVRYEEVGQRIPKAYNSNQKLENSGVAMHVKLPENKLARLEIINLYKQGDGDTITFLEDGYNSNRCIINGKEQSLYDYLIAMGMDDKLPLVADYAGAKINISMIFDHENKNAILYAPVFKDVEYKIASAHCIDYQKEFVKAIKNIDSSSIAFNCNCMMNYFIFELEGKKFENISAPISFGEIAYHLVNQTFTYMLVENMN